MARIAKAKPCPFCKSTDSFVECADFGSFYRVCDNCLARGPEAEGDGCDSHGTGGQNATRAWNKRSKALSAAPGEGGRD